jgi:hypothetical protein
MKKYICISILACYMPICSYAQHWDAAPNFSFSSNPNGTWSYGYTSTSGTGFALLLANVQNPYGWNNGPNTYSPDIGYPSGEFLGLHPYQGTGLAACLRWTAPDNGNYNVSTTFVAPASSTSYNMGQNVYILTNGVVAYQSSLVSYSQTLSTTNLFSFRKSDTIDVVVANKPGVANNWTSVSVIIDLNPHAATATPSIVNGFVVGANIIDSGFGYTNTPLIRFIGGSGSGAQAVAVETNGVITAVNITNPGSGYTNPPVVVIAPPYILNPVLSLAPMSFLSFSNLSIGGVYQLQQLKFYFWSNMPVSFTATNAQFTNIVAGVASSGGYRLALTPVPTQAFATGQVVNGFVVAVGLTSGGSGYVTVPAVTFSGAGGSNATAVAAISSAGVVTNLTLTSPGIHYPSNTIVKIDSPPAVSVSPTVSPMMQFNSTSLSPYDNYQLQYMPNLGATWSNWNGGLFTPTGVTNTQVFFITNNTGFFRLEHLP